VWTLCSIWEISCERGLLASSSYTSLPNPTLRCLPKRDEMKSSPGFYIYRVTTLWLHIMYICTHTHTYSRGEPGGLVVSTQNYILFIYSPCKISPRLNPTTQTWSRIPPPHPSWDNLTWIRRGTTHSEWNFTRCSSSDTTWVQIMYAGLSLSHFPLHLLPWLLGPWKITRVWKIIKDQPSFLLDFSIQKEEHSFFTQTQGERERERERERDLISVQREFLHGCI